MRIAILCLALGGCATPFRLATRRPTCPLGHLGLLPFEPRPGIFWTSEAVLDVRERSREESAAGGSIDLECPSCGYAYVARTRTWFREADSLEGFFLSPHPLIQDLVHRLPASEAFVYEQAHSPDEIREYLRVDTGIDAWTFVAARLGEDEISYDCRGDWRWKGTRGTCDIGVSVHTKSRLTRLYAGIRARISSP